MVEKYMSKLSVDDLVELEGEIIYFHEHGVLPANSKLRETKNKLCEETNCPINMVGVEPIVEHEIALRWRSSNM